MSAAQSDDGQDFEINLAPIIDCFTVLITYLLVSASFISLIVLDVGVAVTGASATAQPVAVPPHSLMIELGAGKAVTLAVTGGPDGLNLKIPIPAVSGSNWAIAALKKEIARLQKAYPDLKEATLNAEPTVIYKDIVRLVEQIKSVIDKVYLSG